MRETNDYALYLRKSRADVEAERSGEGETLARHEKLLTEYAGKHSLHISHIYKEIVSGETISQRPQMQQLLQDVEAGKYAGVLVMEVERLARGNTQDQGIVADAFRYSNTRIVTPIKTYDPQNEFDEEYFEFGLFMSRREYKVINRRIQRGRIASVEEGKFIGSTPPFGYDKVKIPNGKGYTLAVNEPEADIVRKIFDWYVNGIPDENGTYRRLGSRLICMKLDSMGIAPRKASQWHVSSVRDILKNPVYAGMIRWSYDKEVRVKEDGVYKKKRIRNDAPKLVKGLHPAIITEEMFEKAAALLKARTIPTLPSTGRLQNSLTGLIYCKECGAKMTRLAATDKTPYPVLACPNRYCHNVSSPLELVEEQVILALKQWADRYAVEIEKDSSEPEEQLLADLEQQISKKASDLQVLRKQYDNTFTLLEQGVYTPDIFAERNKRLQAQMKEETAALEKLDAQKELLTRQLTLRREYVPQLRHIIATYPTLSDAAAKNDLLKTVIGHITYYKEKQNIRNQKNNANFELSLFPKLPESH